MRAPLGLLPARAPTRSYRCHTGQPRRFAMSTRCRVWIIWTALLCGFLLANIGLTVVENRTARAAAQEKQANADRPIVFKGAKIHTAAGQPIERGVLVVQHGKIVAVG